VKVLKHVYLLGLVLAIYAGFQMLNLPLWSCLPLVLFGGIYIAFIGFFKPFLYNTREKKTALGLSLIGALIMSLGFPPLPTTVLVLAGFVPWLMLEDHLSDNGSKENRKNVFKYFFIGVLGWNIFTTWWVSNSALMAGFVAIALNSLFMSVPFVLYHIVHVRLGKWVGYLALISFWLAFEYNHLHWDISWPWLNLGNALSQYPQLIQWYEYTGAAGGTLWILISNIALFETWKAWMLRKQYYPIFVWLMIVLLPCFWSWNIFTNYQEKGELHDFVAVQPNWEPHYEKFDVPERVQLSRFIELSKAILDTSVELIVYPETSFESVNTRAIYSDRNIQWLTRMVNDYPNLSLLAGIGSYRIFDGDTPQSKNTRERVMGNGQTIYYDSHNSAIQITSGQDSIPIYFKSKFVPGAEIFPYRKLLFFLKPLVDKLGGSIYGLTPQERRTPFVHNKIVTAPIICYESVYPEYCTGYVKEGANVFAIMTNDGWWDNTIGHTQHMLIGAMRAIENRRSIVRSANSGTSAFIDQRGIIHQATEYAQKDAIRAKLHCNTEWTFFVKYGDYISKVALILTGLILILALLKRRPQL